MEGIVKVKQIFELLEVLGYKTPIDMSIADAPMYYSESRDTEISVLDMDLIHLIRAFNKLQNTKDSNFDSHCEIVDKYDEAINDIFSSLQEYMYDLKREVKDNV